MAGVTTAAVVIDADRIARFRPEGFYVVTHRDLPWTVNEERTWHHMKRHAKVKEWREAFCWLARVENIPKLESVYVHCLSHLKRLTRDHCAELGAFKAGLDGIVDAGVLEDDRPPFVKTVTFHTPMRNSINQMSIILIPAA